MEKAIRNTLRNVVTECRRELEQAIGELLQGQFGIHTDGALEPAETLTHLSQADQEYRAQVVASLEHIKAGGFTPAGAVGQLIREVAFTHLNRFCAYKLLEKRRLIRETISRGLNSNGFKFYLADHSADEMLWSGGQQDLAYRHFLEWTGTNLSEEIGILFSPNDPANRLFPPQRVVEKVLGLINSDELAEVWDEDETIGWIYQYFTPKELRDQARKESAAPRNSYELAFRNQFFTPRYVVEFLTDNTLGRLWYEMRQGQTALAERCRYLVRRKFPIWLASGAAPPKPFPIAEDGQTIGPHWSGDDAIWIRPNPNIETWWAMMQYALTIDGYAYAQQHLGVEAGELANAKGEEYHRTGKWNGTFEELRICLFFAQRAWRHGGEEEPEGEYWAMLQALYRAICEAWEREVEMIPHRSKKDPCELRVLDPASGSGHFLLYCFDLLLTIYEEAWEDADLGPALQRDYRGDLVAYRAAVPGLILRHNLHGIDIDLRSTQIAALALWLRAQRAYLDLGLKSDERPRIRRTNIVCAEPMPGEYDLLRDFERTLNPPALIPLVEQVWGQMKLAAEAGSLLQVERALRDAIQHAKRDWLRSLGGNVQLTLFEQSKPPEQQVLNYAGVTDVAFYEQEAEPHALEALQHFAETATGRDDYTRRLFVEDATRGFALIEVLGKQYDVVLMNPPFGEATSKLYRYCSEYYPSWNFNLFCAFVERGRQMLADGGLCGAITDRSYMVKTSYEAYRRKILLSERALTRIVDLGWSVLDANVEVNLLILSKRANNLISLADLSLAERKEDALQELASSSIDWVIKTHEEFEALPNAILSYRLPKWQEQARKVGKPITQILAEGKSGLKPGLVEQFVRLWWEVGTNVSGGTWEEFQNGSPYAPFYFPTLWRVWNDGDWKSIRQIPSSRITGLESYYSPGLTYGKRTDAIYAYVMPTGQVFSTEGMGVFPLRPELRWETLAFINSTTCQTLMNSLAGQHKVHGYFNKMFLPTIDGLESAANHARQVYLLLRSISQLVETDNLFASPLDFSHGRGLRDVDFNEIASRLLETSEQARKEARLGSAQVAKVMEDEEGETSLPWPDIGELYCGTSFGGLTIAANIVQYLLGIVFGRWDIRLLMTPSLIPKLPDPFAQLPSFPPGMLVDQQGLPASSGRVVSEGWLRARSVAASIPPLDGVEQPSITDNEYPVSIAWEGILVDDPDHEADIVHRVRTVLETLWGNKADSIEARACALLGVDNLREYFRTPKYFFDNHITSYSRSTRKSPIYWLLQSPGKRYGLWLYYHRLDPDLLFKALTLYVQPKIRLEESRLQELRAARQNTGDTGAAVRQAAQAVERQEALLADLRDFHDRLERAAKLYLAPDLNDGVLLNIAPLWEVVPWKEAKSAWEQLLVGKYGWSSLGKQLREKGIVKER